ncbi:MAG: DUF2271 domain-containing protein, partial [Phyllobacteriaceae bacterium]|nr:DUF2271 domain-containing protein [Phyllobacteriaceae bacterium]
VLLAGLLTFGALYAGYVVHVDTAVEDGRDYPSDVVVPLTAAQSGKPVAGKGYVKTLKVSF